MITNSIKNYHCEFCDFNAKSEGGLKTHQRAKHKEENPMRGAESSIEENVRSLDISAVTGPI